MSEIQFNAVTVLTADGDDGRVYNAQWTPTSRGRDRLHVTVTDPTIPDDEHQGRPRPLYGEDETLIWTVEDGEKAINEYETAAREHRWPGIEPDHATAREVAERQHAKGAEAPTEAGRHPSTPRERAPAPAHGAAGAARKPEAPQRNDNRSR